MSPLATIAQQGRSRYNQSIQASKARYQMQLPNLSAKALSGAATTVTAL